MGRGGVSAPWGRHCQEGLQGQGAAGRPALSTEPSGIASFCTLQPTCVWHPRGDPSSLPAGHTFPSLPHLPSSPEDACFYLPTSWPHHPLGAKDIGAEVCLCHVSLGPEKGGWLGQEKWSPSLCVGTSKGKRGIRNKETRHLTAQGQEELESGLMSRSEAEGFFLCLL